MACCRAAAARACTACTGGGGGPPARAAGATRPSVLALQHWETTPAHRLPVSYSAGCRFELRKNVPCTLTLQNPTGERVAFKVKQLDQHMCSAAVHSAAATRGASPQCFGNRAAHWLLLPSKPYFIVCLCVQVKTTSPKKYCVRPSSGVVEPGSSKEVQVIMQAQREYPPSLAGAP